MNDPINNNQLLAQSPVVAMLRARLTHARFFGGELGFTPPVTIKEGVKTFVGMTNTRDAVNARFFRKIELALVSTVEVETGSSTSNEKDEGEHSAPHSSQDQADDDKEDKPGIHSGLGFAFAFHGFFMKSHELLAGSETRLSRLASDKITNRALNETSLGRDLRLLHARFGDFIDELLPIHRLIIAIAILPVNRFRDFLG